MAPVRRMIALKPGCTSSEGLESLRSGFGAFEFATARTVLCVDCQHVFGLSATEQRGHRFLGLGRLHDLAPSYRGASNSTTSLAVMRRWRSRPQHHLPTWRPRFFSGGGFDRQFMAASVVATYVREPLVHWNSHRSRRAERDRAAGLAKILTWRAARNPHPCVPTRLRPGPTFARSRLLERRHPHRGA